MIPTNVHVRSRDRADKVGRDEARLIESRTRHEEAADPEPEERRPDPARRLAPYRVARREAETGRGGNERRKHKPEAVGEKTRLCLYCCDQMSGKKHRHLGIARSVLNISLQSKEHAKWTTNKTLKQTHKRRNGLVGHDRPEKTAWVGTTNPRNGLGGHDKPKSRHNVHRRFKFSRAQMRRR